MNVNQEGSFPEKSLTELLKGFEEQYIKWKTGGLNRFFSMSAVVSLRYLALVLVIALAVFFIYIQFLSANKVSGWAEWLLGITAEEVNGGEIAVKKMFSWLVLCLILLFWVIQLLFRQLQRTFKKFDELNQFTRGVLQELEQRFGRNAS